MHDGSSLWEPGFRANLVLTSSGVWEGEGFRVVDKTEQESGATPSILPPDYAFTDAYFNKNLNGRTVYSTILREYVHRRVSATPLLEQEKELQNMERDASAIMYEIAQAMKQERSLSTTDGRSKTLIDNARDFLTMVHTNPAYDGPHSYELFMRIIREKKYFVRERVWFETAADERDSHAPLRFVDEPRRAA